MVILCIFFLNFNTFLKFMVFFVLTEIHPLLLNRSNKDKQGQMAKKAAGRPRK